MIKDGASTEEQIAISHKYPFNSKLTSHPGEGVKIISIKFQECIDDEHVGEIVTNSDILNESFNFSDMSHDILDVSSSSVDKNDIEAIENDHADIINSEVVTKSELEDVNTDVTNSEEVNDVIESESEKLGNSSTAKTENVDGHMADELHEINNGQPIKSPFKKAKELPSKSPVNISDLINVDDSKGKLNSKVNAELKLLRQSIKIKDEKIESLNNKVKELEKKLKSDSKRLSDMKQSRDSFKNLSETLKSKETAHISKINKLEGDVNSKQVIIDFLKSSLGLSDADIPIDRHENTSVPSSQKMVETKLTDDYKSSPSRSHEEIISQENLHLTEDNTALAANSSKNKKESGDLSANSDKLKNNPTDNMKQASDQYYWYEAVNKDGENITGMKLQ